LRTRDAYKIGSCRAVPVSLLLVSRAASHGVRLTGS